VLLSLYTHFSRPFWTGQSLAYPVVQKSGAAAPLSIAFHTWGTPSGRKISVALEEMGLPCAVHAVNIFKGEQFDPAFLKISPNNRIPAIVDAAGPGGKPITIFESCAILIYLGEKTGKFWPKGDLAAQVPVLEWLMWQVGGGFGPMPHQLSHFLTVENETDRRHGIERYSKETRRLYGVLDKRLKGCSPEPCRCCHCPAQAGWAHRRARRKALRHVVDGDRATRRALTPGRGDACAFHGIRASILGQLRRSLL
jgi:GST-like protein